ncbi:phage minor capsid protein [uncultured Planococcus sp.]|uniref:phage minor capsid protein n=1 Tax=uncultured Planococcus sp. TaxID=337815 RepID=UPI002610F9E9|nr:phage minor capsid protein [uncultured Planococcus sp.]
MDLREIPRPTFDYDVNRVVTQYEKALAAIKLEILAYDITDVRRANAMATAASIGAILKKLDVDVSAIIEEIIPQAATLGAAQAMVTLGVAPTVAEATALVKFGKLNKGLVAAVIADTQSDLLQVTQNIDKRVKVSMRTVASEVMREQSAKGINATPALSAEIRNKFRSVIGEGADTAIIDAAGRRWKLKAYTDMLVNTKMLEAHKEATVNEAVERGALYGVISSHGATDACANYEGKIVKMAREAEGDYPYIGDLPKSSIFHPNCRHTVSPVSRLDRLSNRIKNNNNITTPEVTDANIEAAEVVNVENQTVRAGKMDITKSDALRRFQTDPTIARRLGEGGEDEVMKSILREQGFDGPGKIVSASALDKQIKGGDIELYRGVSSNAHAKDFREGELFSGLGTYGNGVYTAYGGLDTATGKRNNDGFGVAVDYAGEKGTIMRMSLASESRVVKYDNLVGEVMDYEDDVNDRIKKAKRPEDKANLESEKLLMSDYGRFAAVQGYDAIDVPGQKYMVVLNRTVLNIQDTNTSKAGD